VGAREWLVVEDLGVTVMHTWTPLMSPSLLFEVSSREAPDGAMEYSLECRLQRSAGSYRTVTKRAKAQRA
jgi:hypothetical protein